MKSQASKIDGWRIIVICWRINVHQRQQTCFGLTANESQNAWRIIQWCWNKCAGACIRYAFWEGRKRCSGSQDPEYTKFGLGRPHPAAQIWCGTKTSSCFGMDHVRLWHWLVTHLPPSEPRDDRNSTRHCVCASPYPRSSVNRCPSGQHTLVALRLTVDV